MTEEKIYQIIENMSYNFPELTFFSFATNDFYYNFFENENADWICELCTYPHEKTIKSILYDKNYKGKMDRKKIWI